MIIWCVNNNIQEDQDTQLKVNALRSQKLLVFENFFFHTISIIEIYMLMKYEGIVKIFKEQIDKSHF